jgi:Protein of unknown function (DUF3761)
MSFAAAPVTAEVSQGPSDCRWAARARAISGCNQDLCCGGMAPWAGSTCGPAKARHIVLGSTSAPRGPHNIGRSRSHTGLRRSLLHASLWTGIFTAIIVNYIYWSEVFGEAHFEVAPWPRAANWGSYDQQTGACGYYINSSGHLVPRPCTTSKGATAVCADGRYSYSEHPYAPGTCSYHGGVVQHLR